MIKRAAYRGGPAFSGLVSQARHLRTTSTDAERIVWRLIRAAQMRVKFRRQHQFGPFILDFYCPERHLAIETDGGQHYLSQGELADAQRSQWLEARGVRVLRFSNLDVLERPDSVAQAIWLAVNPHPSPLPEGEGIDPSHLPLGERA